MKCRQLIQNFIGSDFLSSSGWSRYCLSSLGTEPALGTSCATTPTFKSFSCLDQIEDSVCSDAICICTGLVSGERCPLRLCSARMSLLILKIACATSIGEMKWIRLNRGSKMVATERKEFFCNGASLSSIFLSRACCIVIPKVVDGVA